MNKITLESSNHSPINIPPFDGLASFKTLYLHNLKKPLPTILKIQLTVCLELHEEGGEKKFKIMNVVRKYRINVLTKLTAKELAKIWHESAIEVASIFNMFEQKKFGIQSEINHESVSDLEIRLQHLVDWFYDNSSQN